MTPLSGAGPEPLKPCPFCGHQPEISPLGDIGTLPPPRWSVGCGTTCHATPTVYEDTKALAIASWNRRAPLPALGEGQISATGSLNYHSLSCSHLRVVHVTQRSTDRATICWWQCGDCGKRFVPDEPAAALAQPPRSLTDAVDLGPKEG